MNTLQKILSVIGLVLLSQVPSLIVALLGYNNLYMSVIVFIVMIILIIIFYDDIFDSKNVITEIQQVGTGRIPESQLVSQQSIMRNNLPKLVQRTKTSGAEVIYDNEGIESRRVFLEQEQQRLRNQLSVETDNTRREQIMRSLEDIESELRDLNEVERIRSDAGRNQYNF